MSQDSSRVRNLFSPLRQFSVRLALFGGLALAATIIGYAAFTVSSQTEFAFQAMQTQARALARNIAAASGNYLVTEDYSVLEQLLMQSATYPSVLGIQVTDERGRVYGNVVRDAQGVPEPRFDIVSIDPPATDKAFFQRADENLSIWFPIENASLGWVRIDYSLQAIRQVQGVIWRDGLIAGIFALIISILLLVLLLRRPVRAIELSTEFAKKLYRSKGEVMNVGCSTIEIEQLGHALNYAARRLYTANKELSDMKNALDAHAVVGITDREGRITYVNDKFCEISQYAPQELLGSKFSVVSSGRHPRSHYEDIWGTISSGQIWNGELLDRRKDGSLYWVDTTIVPLAGEDGRPEQFVGIQTDISERKRAEEMNARLGRLLEDSLNEIYMFSAEDLKFITVNVGATTNLGYTVEEMREKTPVDIKPDFDHDAFMSLVQPLLAGETKLLSFITRHERKDGSTYPVEVHVHLSRAEEPPVFVAIIKDISERVEAERRLRDYQEHLEEMVDERTHELTIANRELESFCYSVSHDLRAPLRSIDGFSQALIEDYPQLIDAQAGDYLKRVRAASQRMGELIDDLLKLSRVIRSDMNKECVNMSVMVKKVAAHLQAAEPDRKVEFISRPDLMAEGDGRLLRVALENLLSNAWKFTSGKPNARIEFGMRDSEHGPAFFVSDNGAGFNQDYVHKLFEPFQRLHSNDEFEGTGIGLATVQRIVRRHGGEVWAEGRKGEGATVFFTLQ